MSHSECVCATNVTVGELRVHRCLSSAIVLMCVCVICVCHFAICVSFVSAILPSLCHLCVCHFAMWVSFVCMPFAICVSFVCCVLFCFCSTESRGGFFSKQKAFCQCS